MTAPRDAAREAQVWLAELWMLAHRRDLPPDVQRRIERDVEKIRAALAGASPSEPSDGAIRAYLAAYDTDLRKAGAKGVNAHEQYDFLRRWLGAAYAVDFGRPPTSAPPNQGWTCAECGNKRRGEPCVDGPPCVPPPTTVRPPADGTAFRDYRATLEDIAATGDGSSRRKAEASLQRWDAPPPGEPRGTDARGD